MTIFVDVYTPPKGPHGECTCAGSTPEFPQHESWCGLPEPVESGSWCCGWTDGVCEGCPGRSRIWGAR
ncbi:hypothetical protein O4106_21775 [Rhodococcus pyridinivorans]|uniref:hypothetical protein n=1 Tax=Rhodococcus pyridinivorans TaxID=103816 RepID=UPI0022B4AAA9|nr:hypothetical protein [Rhodococcus pyridinivorans]MCZ4649454.1 hypothetical protein [Rhodococcus pyridinivorans]